MYDFSRITERVFVGAQINGAADLAAIKAAGITHVIDAQAERDDSKQEDWRRSGITVLWAPEHDDGVHPKPVNWFKVAVDFGIAALSSKGNIVLAHCGAGINRGPSLGYAIMRAQGFSAATVWMLFRLKRPQVLIAYHQDAEAALLNLGWIKSIEA